jgi:MinD-like ATPase involved in chromosome partitioning or flagellar assembly
VLVDCPPGLDDTVTSAVLTDADAVVLVTRATPADLHEAAVAAAALKTRTGDGGAGSSVVVAVTSLRSGRWSPRTRSAASALAGHVSGLVRIPYDPALTGYGTIRGPRSRRRTRKAFLRLAATIVETCATADTRQPAAVAGAVRREIG